MEEEKKEQKFPSELRYDPSSDDWVVIASGRAKRPEMFKKEEEEKGRENSAGCPFCLSDNIQKAVTIFENGREVNEIAKNWTTVSIPNKFPAFIPSDVVNERSEHDLYVSMDAVGYHEVVITRDHYKTMGEMDVDKVAEVFKVYKKRYNELKSKKNVSYVSVFHNHGSEAGASIPHPHSQIITTPVVDMDLRRNLFNTKQYYESKGSCMYCDMNEWESKDRSRIVYENSHFLAVCPFASKAAFQVVISPKKHLPFFEDATDSELYFLGEAFKEVLCKINKGLSNPSYNFYLHSAPCDEEDYGYYHWHWTIVPKTSVWGGFEIGAKMEISTIEPEKAAEYLREVETDEE